MIVYQVIPITGYDGWGTPSYGEPIKIFSKYDIAKGFLDEYKPGWDKDSWREWTIKELEID